MNEELQKKLGVALEWVIEGAKSAGDALAEEAPKVAQEIVEWHFYSNAIRATATAVVALAAFVVALLLLRAMRRAAAAHEAATEASEAADREAVAKGDATTFWDSRSYLPFDGFPFLFPALMAFALGLVLCGFAADSGTRAVKAKVAPRLVLLEKAQELLK